MRGDRVGQARKPTRTRGRRVTERRGSIERMERLGVLRADPIGHDVMGTGLKRVVIMNDWLCDTSTWDGARSLLDGTRFTFAFADLRGYGRSRGRQGAFTLEESARDMLALADTLGWSRFSIVGHSMSALIALHLAQQHADRVERAVAVTPPPPTGFGADEAALSASRALALGDDATQLAFLAARFGARLSPGWTAYKASRWRACADPAAAAGYVAMFARDGLPDPKTQIQVPVLAITGEQDVPAMRHQSVARLLEPLCARLEIIRIAESGHYPMQEMPPLTVALVERFLAGPDSK
jgi:3-oxoadipate enol-lactonase